jgi:hypothetical protein
MPIDPSKGNGAFEPRQLAAMGEAFEAACTELHDIGQLQMVAKSLPDELLQRLAGVSLTRFAYARRRYGIIVAQMSLAASG